MNTNDLVRSLENAAAFAVLEAATAKRTDTQASEKYLKIAAAFRAAAIEARDLQTMCVEAITQRISRAKAAP